MSHYYERVLNNKIDYSKELDKLRQIFEREDILYVSEYGTFLSTESYIDDNFFRDLQLSGNYISIKDVVEEFSNLSPIDSFIEYSEFLLSLSIQLIEVKYEYNADAETITRQLRSCIQVIDFDLNKLNLKYELINNELGRIAIIVPKDELLESVLDDIDDTSVSANLIKYKALKTEGNIKLKEEILITLSKYIEPIFKNDTLEKLNHRLYKDVGFMLNNLDLRHNNIKANETKFYNATLNNREEWLDKLYLEILLVIKSVKEAEIHNDIDNLKNI